MVDPVREAWATLAQRPGRTLLTATASALGVGVLVLTVGLTDTLARQVSDEFDALRATEVVVRPALGGSNLAASAEQRVSGINGVERLGTIVRLGPAAIGRTTIKTGEPTVSADVLAVTPGALDALGLTLRNGRHFDFFHTTQAPQVVILGAGVAQRLGIQSPDGTAAVLINDQPHVIIGIADEVTRRPAYTGVVIIPLTNEPRSPTESNLEELLIQTAPGAASVVAQQVAVAISPHAPETLETTFPPDATAFRQGIETSLRSSLLALGVTILIIGLLGIANASFISVLERTSEIGVRRAIGARPSHIWLQVLTESGLTGGIGGTIGSSLAIITLVALTTMSGWTPTITSAVPVLGPLMGACAGCLAGLAPARRATRIQPTEALRL
ncbi:MAG: ABC transporter permease [Acidimicrobiia bacterium]